MNISVRVLGLHSEPNERRKVEWLLARYLYYILPHRITREADVSSAKLGREWVPGTHLIVLRRGYRHHGIYVGGGRVIHYAGLSRHRQGRIEEVSLDDFIRNRPIHLGRAPDETRGHDIVLRARSRLGECRYDLLNNNCEHFCNWCLLGESRSQQVESLTRPIRTIVHLVATFLAFLPVCALSRWGIRGFLS